jgi:serine O-acetyltransferase
MGGELSDGESAARLAIVSFPRWYRFTRETRLGSLVDKTFRFMRWALAMPIYVVASRSPAWPLIERDILRFNQPDLEQPLPAFDLDAFVVASVESENRSLMYYRLKMAGGLWKLFGQLFASLYKGQPALLITPKEMAGGIVISHGLATVIAGWIEEDCLIGTNVTLGMTDKGGPPVIRPRVKLLSGCVVVGPIEVGHDAVVAANAVVVKDVPPGAIMAGVPAKQIGSVLKEAQAT